MSEPVEGRGRRWRRRRRSRRHIGTQFRFHVSRVEETYTQREEDRDDFSGEVDSRFLVHFPFYGI
jgi:hypothetical protein